MLRISTWALFGTIVTLAIGSAGLFGGEKKGDKQEKFEKLYYPKLGITLPVIDDTLHPGELYLKAIKIHVYKIRKDNELDTIPAKNSRVKMKIKSLDFGESLQIVTDLGEPHGQTDDDGKVTFHVDCRKIGSLEKAVEEVEVQVTARLNGYEPADDTLTLRLVRREEAIDFVQLKPLLRPGSDYPEVIQIRVTDGQGSEADGSEAEVSLELLDKGQEIKFYPKRLATDNEGFVHFSVDTSKVWQDLTDTSFRVKITATKKSGDRHEWVRMLRVGRLPDAKQPELSLLVSSVVQPFDYYPERIYPRALMVNVTNKDKAVVKGAEVTVTTQSKRLLFRAGGRYGVEPDPKDLVAMAKTDAAGNAYFAVQPLALKPGQTELPLNIEVNVVHHLKRFVGRDQKTTTSKGETVAAIIVRRNPNLSDRLAMELFIGPSFRSKYDEAGQLTGIGEDSAVALFRIDSLYGKGKAGALHVGTEYLFADYLDSNKQMMEKADDGNGNTTDPMDERVIFSKSFTGSLYAKWQPGRWATHHKTSNHHPYPYDAYRWGLFSRVGFTTREDVAKEENSDSLIMHCQLGVSFTHHQTRFSRKENDNVNVFPRQFLDLSVGWYEQIGNQREAWRFIVRGGLRVFDIGKDLPFYAGVYVNSGEGPDDLRFYFGTLFTIEKIKSIFGGSD